MERKKNSTSSPLPRRVDTMAGALWAEYQAIHGKPAPVILDRDPDVNLEAYFAAAAGEQQTALCLSGGGIRSAAFALGILQGLAERRALSAFHYLSTVSGGGYIGGWLTALIHARGGDVDSVQTALAERVAAPELSELRAYTNFLTPNPALISPDTWAGVVLWVRNVIVNWLIFLPALFAIAVLPVLYRDALATVSVWSGWLLLLAGLGCIGLSAYNGANMLPSHRPPPAAGQQTEREAEAGFINNGVVVPGLVWAFIAPLVAAPGGDVPPIVVAIGNFVALVAAYQIVAWRRRAIDVEYSLFRSNFGWWVLSSLISATLLEIGGSVVPSTLALAVLGPLWVTLAYLTQTLFYVALRTEAFRADLDREWLARLSAVKVVPAAIWGVFAAACLVLPPYLMNWIVGTTGLMSGPLAAYLGKIAQSRLDAVGGLTKSSPLTLPLNIAIAIAAVVFAAVLFALLSAAAAFLSDAFAPPGPDGPASYTVLVDAPLLLIPFALAWGLGLRINVNRFSMHAVYRNRLVRAFLGTARTERTPDPFTRLDAADNLRMADTFERAGPRRLFPVVNVALNVLRGRNTAWTERKAMSFTITPLACGAAYLWRAEDKRAGYKVRGAYAVTESYGGIERETGPDDQGRGITLGTAMTISGAAVSPAMGYHSSAGVAFLMTLFNVRLGAWLPNPATARGEDLLRGQPRNALVTLGRELLSIVDDDTPDVYLSDGGHFDDLGLYEMVRRRCRRIVVVDAGEDAGATFADLGNAVRKIGIDQNIQIEFDPPMAIGSRDAPIKPVRGFALAKIDYPEGGPKGELLYIRPSDPPDAPIDVRAYRNLNPAFPNESTYDQWFTESQFESYRRLGLAEMGKFAKAPATSADAIAALFAAARDELTKTTASPPPGGSAT